MSPETEPLGPTLLIAGLPGVSAGVVRAIEVCERAAEIDRRWLDGVLPLGPAASAAAPEILVQEVVDYAREPLGVSAATEFRRLRKT